MTQTSPTIANRGRILSALLEYLRANLFYGISVELDPETRIRDEGLLNSTGYIEIIGFLESEFSVQFPDGDLVPENFATPMKIADLVCSRLNGAQ